MRRRYLEPNRRGMLKTTFFPKIKKTAKKVDKIHTPEEHAQLILNLKVLQELAPAQELKQQSENNRTLYVQNTKSSPPFQTLKNLLEGLMFGIDAFFLQMNASIFRVLFSFIKLRKNSK